MAARYEDWLKQAEKDLRHAENALEDKDYEWSCFAAQQSAEKGVKALYQKINADAWGHSISLLLANLPGKLKPANDLIEKAKELDKHYIPPRYINAHPQGAPLDYYTEEESRRAIAYAQEILKFCKDKLL